MATAATDRRAAGGPSQLRTDASTSSIPPIYELNAPAWRPRLHPGSHSLGWPDVYPPKPGQAEDVLSESAVKNGVGGRSAVSNETYSAHDMIYDRLNGTQVTSQLGSLFHEVVERRKQLAQVHCGPGPLHHRAPQRVTLNEAKLAAYIKDLADPNVPLRKIARSVPHGYRGERMLDMLYNGGSAPPVLAAARSQQPQSSYTSPAAASTPTASGSGASDKMPAGLPKSIAIDRAVWFVRVVGSSEIASTRARQGSSATYTAEWTTLFYNWLRRQIVELNIIYPHTASANPSSPHPSSTRLPGTPRAMPFTPAQSRDTPYSLFLEEDFRVRWLAKWDYSLALLRAIAREGLLDLQVAARTALDMLRHANRAQIHFVLVLVHELMGAITTSTLLTCQASEVVCYKIRDLRKSSNAGNAVQALCADLQKLVSHLFVSNPDAFVSISVWPLAEPLLCSESIDTTHEQSFAQVVRRNECLQRSFLRMNRPSSDGASSQSELQLVDIAVLDGMCVLYDVPTAATRIFATPRKGDAFKTVVATIIVWATTTWRIGKHRPFAAASLLNTTSTQHAVSKAKARSDIDSAVFHFLCEADAAMRLNEDTPKSSEQLAFCSLSVTSITILLGELYRTGCFSVQKYMQRLTARGMTANSKTSVGVEAKPNGSATAEVSYDSLHARLLRSVPVAKGNAAFESQRRTAIYGNRSKETWEEAMERRAGRELLSALPWLAENASTSHDLATEQGIETSAPVDLKIERFWSSSRHVRGRVIDAIILPRIGDAEWRAACLSPVRLVTLARLLAEAEEVHTLHPFLAAVVAEATNKPLVQTAYALISTYHLIWSAMRLPDLRKSQVSIATATIKGHSHVSRHASPSALPTLDEVKASLMHFIRSNGDLVQFKPELSSLGLTEGGRTLAVRASIAVLQEAGEDIIPGVCSWLRCTSANDKQDEGAYTATFLGLLKNTSDADEIRCLCQLAVPLIEERLVDYRQVLLDGVRPLLQAALLDQPPVDTAIARSDEFADLGVRLLRARPSDSPRDAVITCGQAQLQDAVTSRELLIFARQLCAKEQEDTLPSATADLVRSLRRSLCSLEGLRIFFQGTMTQSASIICKESTRDVADRLISDLLPTQSIASTTGTTDDDFEALIESYNTWRHPTFTLRVALLLQTLEQQRQAGTDDGGNRMLRIARLTSERLSQDSPDRVLALMLPLSSLAPQASRPFTSALVDDRLKKLCHLLTQPDAGMPALADSLLGLVKMLKHLGDTPLVASPGAVQAFTLVQTWFEDVCRPLGDVTQEDRTANDADDAALGERGPDLDAIHIRCGVLCLLMRMDELLTVATIKSHVPKLVTSLLRWMLHRLMRPDTSEEDVVPVLDTAQNVLQLASVDVQVSVQQSAYESVAAMLQSRRCLFDDISRRLLRLCSPHGSILGTSLDATLTTRTPLVEAPSHAAALGNGQFTPAPAKPWDWHPNPDAMRGEGEGLAASATTHATTEMGTLANHGPLSLSLFDAHKTLDRLPHSDATVRGGAFLSTDTNSDDEEQWRRLEAVTGASYGLHLGGVSAWSRDVLHGYSLADSDEHKDDDDDWKEHAGDYGNLTRTQMRKFVPALGQHMAKMDEIKRQEKAKALAAIAAQEEAERKEQLEKAQRDKREEARLKAQDRKRKRQESAAATVKSKADDAANKASATTNGKKRKGSTAAGTAETEAAPATVTSVAKGKAAGKATASASSAAAAKKRSK